MDRPDDRQSRPPMRDGALIAGAIVVASLVLSWGMSRNEPRYQIAAAGDMVVRMDTDSGELIACDQQRCARVQPPDRARTFGPLTVQVGDSEKLPPPETNRSP